MSGEKCLWAGPKEREGTVRQETGQEFSVAVASGSWRGGLGAGSHGMHSLSMWILKSLPQGGGRWTLGLRYS